MIDELFKKFHQQLQSTYGNGNVIITPTDIQIKDNTTLLWFGTVSLGLTLSFVDKNVCISINPTKIKVGTYERSSSITVSVLNENFKRSFKLDVDDGELFQLSTMYDFDFLVLKNIMTKYLELLKVLPNRKYQLAIDEQLLKEATTNIEKVISTYDSEKE